MCDMSETQLSLELKIGCVFVELKSINSHFPYIVRSTICGETETNLLTDSKEEALEKFSQLLDFHVKVE